MTSTKTNRVVSVLLAIVMILALNTVFCFQTAYADTYDNWQYTVSDGKATLTAYIGTATTITVPATINGYSVQTVSGIYSTTYKTKVVSIILSSGIKEIGASAFKGYTSLTRVTIPDSVTKIGASAFADCTALSGITLPSSVSSIGSSAFQNCTALTTAALSCKATSIPKSAFSGCSKLANVTLPNSCTTIDANAFSGCTALTNIYLPDTITTINSNAFYNCSSLKGTLSLPSNIKTIDEMAFSGCTGITSVIIPNKAKTIGDNAFSNCTALTAAYFGNSVSTLGTDVFAGCLALEKAVFGGEFVKLASVFDSKNVPTVYYPSGSASSWKSYTGTKKSYSNPTAIALSGTMTAVVGGTATLKATITPNTSSVGNLCFYSTSNPAIATVNSNGVVTGKTGGSVTITATTINGISTSTTVKITPKTVTNVKAVPVTTSSVKVTWSSGTNVTGYIVYRSSSANGTYTKLGTTLTTSYTDKGLTKGSTYYYKVRAYVTNGSASYQSAMSTAASVKATSPAPATIKGTKYSSGYATIQWSKAIGAEGYQVAYATSPNGTYYAAKTITSGSTLALRKGGLTPGKTYYFKVRSYITVNGTKVYSNFTNTVAVKV